MNQIIGPWIVINHETEAIENFQNEGDAMIFVLEQRTIDGSPAPYTYSMLRLKRQWKRAS